MFDYKPPSTPFTMVRGLKFSNMNLMTCLKGIFSKVSENQEQPTFSIRDDSPVNRGLLPKYTVFHKATLFGYHLQPRERAHTNTTHCSSLMHSPLFHTLRVSSGFYIHITAIALSESTHLRIEVTLCGVEDNISTTLPSNLQLWCVCVCVCV